MLFSIGTCCLLTLPQQEYPSDNRLEQPALLPAAPVDLIATVVGNVQRVNLHPVDEAFAVHKLKAKYKYTQEQIGNLIGKAHNTVSDILALTKLSEEVRTDASTQHNLSRNALLKIARKRKAADQKRAYDALMTAISNKAEGMKRPKKDLHVRAIDTTDRTLRCIQGINLDELGDNREAVETKLRELLTALQNTLGTTRR